MRATSLGFILTSSLVAALFSIALWACFKSYAPWPFFLIPFFFIIFTRGVTSRLEEINARAIMNMELLAAVLSKDPEFDIRDYLVANGFEDEYEDEYADHD